MKFLILGFTLIASLSAVATENLKPICAHQFCALSEETPQGLLLWNPNIDKSYLAKGKKISRLTCEAFGLHFVEDSMVIVKSETSQMVADWAFGQIMFTTTNGHPKLIKSILCTK